MGFTRLSTLVLSQSPVEKSSRICSDTNRSVKTLVISRILTLFPLLAALTITLLALLLPSPSIHTGLLSIHPSGRTIAPTAAINSTTLDDDPLAFSGIPPNSTFALNSSSVPDSVVGKNAVLWYGTSGPSMWIGVMQVCSRVYPQADVTCTLSSQAAYHAAFLPLSLGMSLFALPLSPPAPILLLLSSVAIILSILALCLEWILPCLVRKCRGAACAMPWTRRFPPLEDRDKMYSDSDSMIELVDRPRVISSVAEGRLLPNLGFAALATAGLILNIVGVALEMTSMRNVVAAWNAKEAVDVGMVISIRPMAILLCFVPILISTSIVVAYAPKIVQRMWRRSTSSEEGSGGAVIRERRDISPLFNEPIIQIQHSQRSSIPLPLQIQDGGVVKKIEVTEVDRANVPMEGTLSGGERQSRRHTQSPIGVAV